MEISGGLMKRFLLLLAVILAVCTYFVALGYYKEVVFSSKQKQPSNASIPELKIEVIGDIIDYNRDKNTVILKVTSINNTPANEKWLLRANTFPLVEESLQTLNFRLRCIVNKNQYQYTSYKNIKGFDYDLYLFAVGITQQYKIIDYEWVEVSGFHLNTFRHDLRLKMENILYQMKNQNSRSFLVALILGDKSAFDDYDAFKDLGLAHIFAISGLHFGVLYAILKKGLLIPHTLMKSICILGLMGFLLFIIGPTPSAQRAFILIVYKEGCDLFERKSDAYVGIALALIIILTFQPFLVLSTSFHLSFYAYFCVAIAYRTLFSKALSNKLLEALRFAMTVQILLLPATLFYFQKANLFTFISNALLVPMVSIILPLAFIYIGISVLNIPLLVSSFRIILELLITCVMKLSQIMPLNLSTFSIFRAFDYAAILYMILAIALFKIFWSNKAFKSRIMIMHWIIIICIVLYGSIPGNTISFIDVGHGDFAILSSGNIHGIIDAGDGRLDVGHLLQSKGVYQLEFVVISHAHQDHMGDLKALSQAMDIKAFYMNQATADKILETQPELSGRLVVITEDHVIRVGKHMVITLIPIVGPKSNHDPNEDAIIAKVSFNSQTGYFLGDISKSMLDTIPVEGHLSFVKSAHHGSNTSLSDTFYSQNNIAHVVTSCHTRYKMPHRDFIELIKKYQLPHYSTYNYGEVKLTFWKNKVKLKTYLSP